MYINQILKQLERLEMLKDRDTGHHIQRVNAPATSNAAMSPARVPNDLVVALLILSSPIRFACPGLIAASGPIPRLLAGPRGPMASPPAAGTCGSQRKDPGRARSGSPG